MLSTKLKAVYAVALLFGMLNVASAGFDTACDKADPYSKFQSNCCCKHCPEYPQQYFPQGSV